MRVAVVFFSKKTYNKMINISKAFVKGIESQGHQVDLIDGYKSMDKKLTMYKYIIIGTEAENFFGKISEKISIFLAQAGKIMGTKSCGFVLNKIIGSAKAVENLMSVMEKEGMFLKFSDILKSPPEAEELGKSLHIGD